MARRFGSFPVILETYRECLQDWFDLPALTRLLAAVQNRQIDVVEVEQPLGKFDTLTDALLFCIITVFIFWPSIFITSTFI